MNYPKPIMRWNELRDMGMPEETLKQAYKCTDKVIAWKISNARNSPIVFDTELLNEFIQKSKKKELEIQRQMRRQYVV